MVLGALVLFALSLVPVSNTRGPSPRPAQAEPAQPAMPDPDSKLSSVAEIQPNAKGEILGQVRDQQGKSMPNVEVVFAGSGVWPARKAGTDSSGRFHLKGVPEGIYELRASAEGLVAEPLEGLILKDAEKKQVTLVLGPGQTLSATVLDAQTRKPIASAQVVVSEDALGFTPKATRTDAQGKFAVKGLRAMMHRVSVRAPGYVAVIGAQHQPQAKPVELTLERGATLAGKLIDESGKPVTRATIEVMGSESDETPILLSASSEVFRDSLFTAQMSGPTPVYPAGELGVTFGKVPRIPHTPLSLPASSGTALATDMRFASDSNGAFSLNGVPPGTMQIVARHPDYAWSFSPTMQVRAGATLKNITLTMSKGGSIQGQVIDAAGAPVPHVRVQIKPQREPWPRHALTDPQGRFEVTALLGAVEVDAYTGSDSLARVSVLVESGVAHAVTLRLAHAAFTLAGRVLEQGRFGVSGAQVTVRTQDVQRTTVTTGDGSFEVSGLPEPPYTISVDHSDYAVYQASNIAPGRSLVIALQPGGQVLGQVFGSHSGAPITNATVQARPTGGGPARQARTDNIGKFEISRLSVGSYEIIVSAPGYTSSRASADLPARRFGMAEVDLRNIELDPAGSISGEVVDRFGQPVAGAQVAYGDPPAWEQGAITNEKGIFRMTELPPGRYLLSGRHPEAGQGVSRREIRVYAGQDSPTAYLRLEATNP